MRVQTCLAILMALAGVMTTIPAVAHSPCDSAIDLRLINGKIHPMDSQNRIVDEVGRFAYVGPSGNQRLEPCTKVINLHGRTVVPSLIDNHNHIVLFGMRLGHDIWWPVEGGL